MSTNGNTQVLATIELAEKSNPLVYDDKDNADQRTGNFSARRALRLLWTHFTESYSNIEVLQWSLWWAVTMAGFMQVMPNWIEASLFVCVVPNP